LVCENHKPFSPPAAKPVNSRFFDFVTAQTCGIEMRKYSITVRELARQGIDAKGELEKELAAVA